MPDTVSPPGETLAELLAERGMTPAQLARRVMRELSVSVRPEVGRGVVRVESRCAATIERGTTPASR